MGDMKISEAQAELGELARCVEKLLNDFASRTRVKLTSISMNKYQTLSGEAEHYHVDIEAKL